MTSSTANRLLVRGLGVLCIVAGLTLNVYFFTAIAPDGDLEGATVRGAIWLFDIVMVLAGVAILWFRPRIPTGLFMAAGILALLALVGLELAIRMEYIGKRYGTQRLVSPLGWESKPLEDRIVTDPIFGTIRYTTDERGFRAFGDPSTSRTKIFFLGDSFTPGMTVNDGEQFYHRIAQMRDDVEVFAYGVGGYSNLQEYMVLDRWFDEIKPDIVIFQMSPNDLMNNSWELESRSAFNSMTTRPYWEDGRIVERFPSQNPLIRHSRFVRYAAERVGFLGAENEAMVENTIDRQVEEQRELWDDAVETTVELLRMSKERAQDAKFAAFEATPVSPVGEIFPELIPRAGVAHLDGIPAALAAVEATGEKIDFSPQNIHWNQRGNQVAAEHILAWLVAEGWLPPVAVKGDSR